MKRFVMAALVFAAAIGLAATSQAATVSSTVSVGVSVSAACSVIAADLSFPSWNGGSAVTGTGSITVNCTSGTPFNIALNSGSNTPSTPTRKLSHSTGTFTAGELTAPGVGLVPYTINQGSPTGPEWGDSGFGDTYASGTVYSGTGTGSNQTIPLFGQIPAVSGFSGGPGQYVDNVIVTVHH